MSSASRILSTGWAKSCLEIIWCHDHDDRVDSKVPTNLSANLYTWRFLRNHILHRMKWMPAWWQTWWHYSSADKESSTAKSTTSIRRHERRTHIYLLQPQVQLHCTAPSCPKFAGMFASGVEGTFSRKTRIHCHSCSTLSSSHNPLTNDIWKFKTANTCQPLHGWIHGPWCFCKHLAIVWQGMCQGGTFQI